MKHNHMLHATVLLLSIVICKSATAAIDIDAADVLLRTSCTENAATIDNCFDDLNTLNTWIWGTRFPSPSSPLQVNIGPGTFTGQFNCTGSGFVTLSGSGIGNTIVQNASSPISTTQCVNLVFNDMTLKNTGNLFGVKNRGGTTTWNNIEIIGLGYAWFDSPGGCGGAPGSHYWFNSRIIAETTAAFSATAYFNACDESWFFGSEIVSKGSEGSSTPIRAVGGEVHVYGSVIRSIPDSGATMTTVTAVTAAGTSEIHIHGTGIDVISDVANDIVALESTGTGHIHANASSYVLKTGTGGTKTRISNRGGKIMAPYAWHEDVSPPDIVSVNGADTAVVYDSAVSNSHPQMVIYDDSCTSGWFDINTNACY